VGLVVRESHRRVSAVVEDLDRVAEEIRRAGHTLFGNPGGVLAGILGFIASHFWQIISLLGVIGAGALVGISLWNAWQVGQQVSGAVGQFAPIIGLAVTMMMFMMVLQPIMGIMSSFSELFEERRERTARW